MASLVEAFFVLIQFLPRITLMNADFKYNKKYKIVPTDYADKTD